MELGERGSALWEAYGADKLPAGTRALVEEACRMADTLDGLARLAAGDVDAWAKLKTEDGDITLEISSLVAERRQQQLAFKQIMAELRQQGLKQGTGKPKDEAADDDNDDPGAIILRLQRRSAAG